LQPPDPSGVLEVRDIGSMHVGGRSASLDGLPPQEIRFSPGGPVVRIDPNGDFEIEQMYVQYVRLARPRARHPLLLMHGGGLCGTMYETKPDGRPGWQRWFLQAGHDVFVADAVERGRASWARSPQFFQGEPVFRTKAEAWELFRIGAEGSWAGAVRSSAAHPDTLFPVAAFDQFMKQSMPRWASTEAAVQAAYNTLARLHGPFVVVTHSQGGNFAFAMALAHPEKIRAIVAVEPSGFPDPASNDLARLAGIPHLMVWGDHLQASAVWRQVRPRLAGYRAALVAAGVDVEDLDLPALGIAGNSHLPMMDSNSDGVAARIQAWMERKGLVA
jgi:pimeloyl-ACP methyl ester carboxylesterase